MRSIAMRFLRLGIFYFAQGLPFGLQVMALPVILASRGVSYSGISLSLLLALPYSLKLFAAPLVDRYASARLGRRRSWILPLSFLSAGIAAIGASNLSAISLTPLLLTIFFLNLTAALSDIAVDALAVSTLRPNELGYGNAIQVGAYKVGMLTTGGLLLMIHARIGDAGILWAIASMNLIAALFALMMPPDRAEGEAEAIDMRELWDLLREMLRSPFSRAALVLALTYKLGESMMDALFRPFLTNAGYAIEVIGELVGIYGTVAGIAGTIFGGVLYARIGMMPALVFVSVGRALALLGEYAFVAHGLLGGSHEILAWVSIAEHFASGMITTVVFSMMMRASVAVIGGTSFTLLATAEVMGKGSSGFLAGFFADRFGVAETMLAGVILSFAFFAVVYWIHTVHRRAHPEAPLEKSASPKRISRAE